MGRLTPRNRLVALCPMLATPLGRLTPLDDLVENRSFISDPFGSSDGGSSPKGHQVSQTQQTTAAQEQINDYNDGQEQLAEWGGPLNLTRGPPLQGDSTTRGCLIFVAFLCSFRLFAVVSGVLSPPLSFVI